MWWWVDRQSKEGSNCKQLVMIATHDREQYNIVVCDGAAPAVVTLSKQNTEAAIMSPTIDHSSAWFWSSNNQETFN